MHLPSRAEDPNPGNFQQSPRIFTLWRTQQRALGTHGFHLSAHTGRAKRMKGERSGRERGICGFANTGRVPSKSSGVPSNVIRQAFCMPTAAGTNTSHPVTSPQWLGTVLTAPNSAGSLRDLSPCPEISSLGYCHICPCGAV